MNILDVKGLTKRYGDVSAVDDISFSVSKGDIYGLVGPNGAGKSTTINMISGLLVPNNGEILFDDTYRYKDWHTNIGLVPQDLAIYPELSAEENVLFFASLYGLKGKELKSNVNKALSSVGLTEHKNKRVEHFSGGMKRRLNIACAIAHNPKLIIMDEPTVGIDPQSRNFILESIRELQQAGTTIIYTSHYMEEVEEICNRILIIDHGSIVLTGQTQEVINQFKKPGAESKVPTLEEVFLTLTGKGLRD